MMGVNIKLVLGIIGGVLIVLFLLAVFAGGGMGGMGQMMGGQMIGGGMFGLIFMGLFWILAIALVVGLVALIVNLSNRR